MKRRVTFTEQYVHNMSCIHPMSYRDGVLHMCNEPCTTDTPHGWLCTLHEALLHRRSNEEVKA